MADRGRSGDTVVRGEGRGEGRSSRERRGSGLKPVGDLVGDVLSSQGVAEQVERVGVMGVWDEVVGEKIASMTRPRSVSGTQLIVAVRSSPWLTELTMMRHQILERLNEAYDGPPIERILFVLGDEF